MAPVEDDIVAKTKTVIHQFCLHSFHGVDRVKTQKRPHEQQRTTRYSPSSCVTDTLRNFNGVKQELVRRPYIKGRPERFRLKAATDHQFIRLTIFTDKRHEFARGFSKLPKIAFGNHPPAKPGAFEM